MYNLHSQNNGWHIVIIKNVNNGSLSQGIIHYCTSMSSMSPLECLSERRRLLDGAKSND